MNDNFESIVSNKIMENSNLLFENLSTNFYEISAAGKASIITFSAAKTLDLLFQNKNYGKFDLELLYELLSKKIEYNKPIKAQKIENNLLHDLFYLEQLNLANQNFVNRRINNNDVENDINSFLAEFVLGFMDSMKNLNTPSEKTFFQFNIFISLYIYPLINSDENGKSLEKTIKNKLINDKEFLDKKDNFNIVFDSTVANMIRNHSEVDFITAIKIFKGTYVPKVENKNCYIATLVYDDINHPNVEILRDYRDNKLLKYTIGQLFVRIYYFISPTAVRVLKPFKNIQNIIRLILDKLILKIDK